MEMVMEIGTEKLGADLFSLWTEPVQRENRSAPNFSAPNFSAPNFSAPNFSVPNFSVPNFSVPISITISTIT